MQENLKPKHMRIVHPGYENFTGPLGPFEFVDGLSIEAIPLFQRDRLATAFQFVEINEDGTEQGAGPAERLLRESTIRAESTAALPRMTQAEKMVEDIAVLLKGEKVPELRSRKNLEDLADSQGIKGVRLVADGWNVRSKSIPVLIELIMAAQEKAVAGRVDFLVKSGVDADAAKALFALRDDVAEPIHPADANKVVPQIETPVIAAEPQPEPQPEGEVVEAAISGDMGAGIMVDDEVVEDEQPAPAEAEAEAPVEPEAVAEEA